jgi:hypothetical protein
MAWRAICILALALAAASSCLGDSGQDRDLSVGEYSAELDRLIEATQHLDRSGEQSANLVRTLPSVWRVREGQQKFDISTEWLRRDLLKADGRNPELIESMQQRLRELRADAAGYQAVPRDISGQRTLLASILSRSEFRDVRGPSWLDRLKLRLMMLLIRLLERIFQSSAIPAIGKIFVYSLLGLAVLALAMWIYHSLRADAELERIALETLPVSAKEWASWMAEARAAANQGNWRDAIHLAYWAGISFLESQGAWKPDRARTPREYLRLMPQTSERHSTLAALTRSFEIVWYGKREADSAAFSQTLQELEKLGCRSS